MKPLSSSVTATHPSPSQTRLPHTNHTYSPTIPSPPNNPVKQSRSLKPSLKARLPFRIKCEQEASMLEPLMPKWLCCECHGETTCLENGFDLCVECSAHFRCEECTGPGKTRDLQKAAEKGGEGNHGTASYRGCRSWGNGIGDIWGSRGRTYNKLGRRTIGVGRVKV
jgi:hypothetical protein